mgnify:CR=1 FL=1
MGILQVAFFIILLAVSYQDIKRMEIKDGCHAAIVLLAVAAILLDKNPGILSRLLGVLCVSAPMFALTLLIPGAFGGGDIKLVAAAGLFLGWENTVIAAVLAVFAGGVYALYLVLIQKADREQRFPFGPFLCVGMAAAVLWGNEIREFWMNL